MIITFPHVAIGTGAGLFPTHSCAKPSEDLPDANNRPIRPAVGYVALMGILIVVLVVLAIIALLIYIFGRGRR
jgi:hypothetical protein